MNRIVRVKSEKGFTIINNAVFTSGLSLRSIGLLTFILHLPDDWELYKKWLYTNLKEGRDAINVSWSELEKAGFIHRDEQPRTMNGKFEKSRYIIYDKPVKSADFQVTDFQEAAKNAEKPFTEKPLTGKPLTENPHLLNTNIQITKEPSTKEPNTSLAPVGAVDPSPTVNLELEEKEVGKKKAERLPIPDTAAEIKKERHRYETEIFPTLANMANIDAKKKVAEYIQEKKPAFYEPYKDLWNLSAPANGLAKVEKMSDTREKQFKTRLKDPDFDFIAVMMAIKKNAFLKGDNPRGWRVNWEYIFKNDTNYLKILEGNFQ